MRYISTRGTRIYGTFLEVLLEGLAPNGGLYVPEKYPRLDLKMLRGCSYNEIAKYVFGRYAPDVPVSDLAAIIDKTFTVEVFGSKEITPVQKLGQGLYLLKLSEGPTLAFKDVALQLLGNLMEYALKKKGETLNVLGATSGDTGSAAAYALRGKKGINLFMLSPYGRMSRFQQMQMYTLDDPNIHNLVVNGTFDDCQDLVKKVNTDAEFKKEYKLGAVNSINVVRVLAQAVYYIYAYLQVATSNTEEVEFSVPSGNFGNALAAHVARQMGLPIKTIIVATNENDVLNEFFKRGTYRVRKRNEVLPTSSPSMDIGEASNFERLIFDTLGRDSERLCALWSELKSKGEFSDQGLSRKLWDEWWSGSATEEEVLRTILHVDKTYEVVIDPHTAVAMQVGMRERSVGVPLIVCETAQPAKFEETIMEALGRKPPMPKGYERLAELPEHTTRIDADVEQVKEFIRTHVK